MIVGILMGIVVAALLLHLLFNFNNLIPGKKTRTTPGNDMPTKPSPEQLLKQHEHLYKDAEFVNKHCTDLDTFIINDSINTFDLRKLADLNGITLQIKEGWYPLTIELIKELYANGWDKSVYCIKEKYASLRFYTHYEYKSPVQQIINRYEKKSEYICETCGERGEIRSHGGWQYTACRKHYLENRGKITVQEDGFYYKGNFHSWHNIKDAVFREPDYFKKYQLLILGLRKATIIHRGEKHDTLYISDNAIGFGNFLAHLPHNFESMDKDYIRHFEHPEFCEICGYKAVYFNECECCENDSWAAYIAKWNKTEEDTAANKYEHLKFNQICWAADEGEHYERQQNNYAKNQDHQILYTETELKTYEEELEND